MSSVKIAKGYLHKITGEWEKQPGLEPQVNDPSVEHLIFWQESDNHFGSWVITPNEELHLNWGESISIEDELESHSYGEPLELLDCDEGGMCEVWLVDYDPEDDSATVLIKSH